MEYKSHIEKAIEIEEKLGNQEFIEALKYTPGIHVNVQGGGSSVGIKSVHEGSAEIGTSSKELVL